MRLSNRPRAITLFLMLVAFSRFISVQNTSVVQISGSVTDPSGAAISGAAITAIQTNTGLTRSTTSAADGAYLLPNLPLGPYRLEVSASGFQTYGRSGIILQV